MKYDVLVVGAGPVGLTTALLLARQGIRVGVIEKDQAPSSSPSAVALDDECLRIWQACGLEHILNEDWEGGHDGRVMCEYLSARGHPFLRLTQQKSDLGYPQAVVIHLARITDKLWRQALRNPSIALMTGRRVVAIEQDQHCVSVQCRSDDDSIVTYRGSWVVGCDGGSSMTRSLLGINMLGMTLPNPWLVADLEDDRSKACVQIRCDPARPSVTIPMPHGVRRIECQLPTSDDVEWLADETEVRRRLIEAWPGAADAPILALTIKQFNARIAERWRRGRVFLAGDAAHLTPPFAGQGLATGLRDASNLAFKLAGVRHGWLAEHILDTYEQERRPHQERMIRLALRLGGVMAPKSRTQAIAVQSCIRALMTINPVRKQVQMRGPGIRPMFSDGFLNSGGLAGRYFPQPWVKAEGSRRVRFDTLLGPRMTWVAIGDSKSRGQLQSSLLSPGDTALVENCDFRDPNRTLQRLFGTGSLVLVRPDRIIHTHCVPSRARTFNARNTSWLFVPTHQSEPQAPGAVSA